MNILVCGSAPCFISDTKNKDLSEFDKIVRVNAWDDIIKSNVWAGQPHVVMEARDAEEMWCVTPNGKKQIYSLTGRRVDYSITRQETGKLHVDMDNKGPTSGMVAIWMALNLGANVSVCGFDFYESDQAYYNPDLPFPNIPDNYLKNDRNERKYHNLKNEKEWFLKKINLGYFKYLK